MADQEFTTFNEIWKPIPDFPGYEVSDHGRVRSYWKRVSNGFGKGSHIVLDSMPQHYFARNIGSSGYVQIVLQKNGKYYNRRVHRIVLEVFKGPCPPGMEGAHNDGNRLINYVSNLRWDTRKNNLHDKNRHGTNYHSNTRPKLTKESVWEIRCLFAKGINRKDIAMRFGIKLITVYGIVTRKRWKNI